MLKKENKVCGRREFLGLLLSEILREATMVATVP
jgi:hypothetical protein